MSPAPSTIGELAPGDQKSGWLGVGAPKSTPAEIIDKLNNEVNACSTDPEDELAISAIGIVLTPMTPAQFEKFIADEIEKWAKVIKFAGIKPA